MRGSILTGPSAMKHNKQIGFSPLEMYSQKPVFLFELTNLIFILLYDSKINCNNGATRLNGFPDLTGTPKLRKL